MFLDQRLRQALLHCMHSYLHPKRLPPGVGAKTVEALVARGWIAWREDPDGTQGYKVTEAGAEAYREWRRTLRPSLGPVSLTAAAS